MLLAAGVAVAAAHFHASALYTGKSCDRPGGIEGTTCVYKFRATADGSALKFIGRTVVSTWICHGGGGEALLGGTVHGAAPIPVVKVRPKGGLYGSARKGESKVTVTGHLTGGGETATLNFHLGNQGCTSPKVTLTAQ
jgi:hypothetical protein